MCRLKSCCDQIVWMTESATGGSTIVRPLKCNNLRSTHSVFGPFQFDLHGSANDRDVWTKVTFLGFSVLLLLSMCCFCYLPLPTPVPLRCLLQFTKPIFTPRPEGIFKYRAATGCLPHDPTAWLSAHTMHPVLIAICCFDKSHQLIRLCNVVYAYLLIVFPINLKVIACNNMS